MPPNTNDLTGRTLGQGQYEIRDIIGKGGMATVYRGVQRSVGREVAIKVLSPDLASDERLLARFEREARIVAQLQHPHILTVHDFGRENGILYLVLRLMNGGSLLDELRARGSLPVSRTLTLVEQIASALDYAHGRGIVHRDLKPSNVLLDESGSVSLTDFGIAKMVQGGETTGLTSANAMMGTPIYMAPEQWRSEPVSPRTDVYALGVMAYWMVAGQVPFNAETPHGLMYQHLHEAPDSPRRFNADMPRPVEPVLERALAKAPESRYESAGAFAAALERAFLAPARSRTASEPRPGYQPDRTQRTVPPSSYGSRSSYGPPSQYGQSAQQGPPPSRYGTRGQPSPPPREERLTDRLRSAHQPLTSTGYTPPRTNHYPDRRHSTPYEDRDPGIARFFWVIGGVSLVVVVALVVMLVAGLIATRGANDSPSNGGAGDTTPAASDVPDSLRPLVTIQQPANQALVSLGNPVQVEFIASGDDGITEVQLLRFSQVIDQVQTGGVTRYQGVFFYTPDSTGPHTLEVIPWNGKIAGKPERVTIFVQ